MFSKCLRRYYGQRPKLPACEFVPQKYVGPTFENVTQIRKDNLVPCIKSHFSKPVLIHQGHMQWLFDHTGKRYLDMFAGIVTVSVGHCHPRVTEALNKQLSQLWHTTHIYMHPTVHEYVEELVSKFPGDLKVAYLVNSGSEANDLAMLMARLHTGNNDIIGLKNCFHGGGTSTIALNGLSTWKYAVPSLGIHHVKNPDVYKGQFGGKHCRDSPIQTQRDCKCQVGDCEAATLYANEVQEIISHSLPKGKIAAFIAESIQGVGGTVQYPKDYLKKTYDLVRRNGGVCIADEVQSGMGRTGDHFWGFEGHGVVPDIVTVAKGIGNGFPLAAVITTPEIAKCLGRALHFNTFGGNPMASAVGLEVLKVIESEKLQENCKIVGTYLLERLSKLRDKYSIVGDVRGKGLMIGMELVSNKESKEPLPAPVFGSIWDECKNLGLLIGAGGLHGNVFRIKPPMCITKDDADFTVEVIETAINMHHKEY